MDKIKNPKSTDDDAGQRFLDSRQKHSGVTGVFEMGSGLVKA